MNKIHNYTWRWTHGAETTWNTKWNYQNSAGQIRFDRWGIDHTSRNLRVILISDREWEQDTKVWNPQKVHPKIDHWCELELLPWETVQKFRDRRFRPYALQLQWPFYENRQSNHKSCIGKPNGYGTKNRTDSKQRKICLLSALRLCVWHFYGCNIQLLCIYQCLLIEFGGQNRGKFFNSVSPRVCILILLPQIGHSINSVFIALGRCCKQELILA